MPKTQREMIKLLKSHGFVEYRDKGKGSHVKMKKKGFKSISIPKGELKTGTEKNILKAAGLK